VAHEVEQEIEDLGLYRDDLSRPAQLASRWVEEEIAFQEELHRALPSEVMDVARIPRTSQG
jgi:hypothetical protein